MRLAAVRRVEPEGVVGPAAAAANRELFGSAIAILGLGVSGF